MAAPLCGISLHDNLVSAAVLFGTTAGWSRTNISLTLGSWLSMIQAGT